MWRKRDSLYYWLIRIAFILASFIPRKIVALCVYPVGWIWFKLDRYHRNIALDNMTQAFKDELDPAACYALAQSNFFQLIRVALELPSLLRLEKDNMHSYVEICGEDNVKEALDRGKGVLFLTAHLGNWELMALATPLKFNFPSYVMVRPLDHKPMDAILTEIRSRTGNCVIDKDKSAGLVRGLLLRNQVIGILLDQNASWYEGVYVPFFGRTACTNKGLAMFALRYDATVVPAFNSRLAGGRYRIIFHPPVSLIKTGDIGRDIVENTALFNRIIEENIRMAPDNWLWVHRRWRIKPIPESARKKIRGNVDFDDLTFV